MRILHTADWHVGRSWKNISRLDENAEVLDHLARFVEREKVDLVVVAGDLFDTGSPPAEAERLVFQFFRRVGMAGVPSVVIAGNHDNPNRFDAWGMLAELANVHTVGRPRLPSEGGVINIATKNGAARIAALPFAPPRALARMLQTGGERIDDKATYPALFRQAIAHLSREFRPDTVNVIVSHTHVQGAKIGSSERPLHLSHEWEVLPIDFPASAQYVALGHIHKPQRIELAAIETRFAGSPLQLDFAEAGEAKSFVVIDADPGKPVTTHLIPYEGGQPLADLRLTLRQIDQQRLTLQSAGWLRVTVPLDEPDPDLSRKVRALAPNALVVHAETPAAARTAPPRPSAGARPVEYYRAYHLQERGETAAEPLVDAFCRLYESAQGDNDAPLALDA